MVRGTCNLREIFNIREGLPSKEKKKKGMREGRKVRGREVRKVVKVRRNKRNKGMEEGSIGRGHRKKA